MDNMMPFVMENNATAVTTYCAPLNGKNACCLGINKPCNVGECCNAAGTICRNVTSGFGDAGSTVPLCCYPGGANGTCSIYEGAKYTKCCDTAHCVTDPGSTRGKCVANPKKGGGEVCKMGTECESGVCRPDPILMGKANKVRVMERPK